MRPQPRVASVTASSHRLFPAFEAQDAGKPGVAQAGIAAGCEAPAQDLVGCSAPGHEGAASSPWCRAAFMACALGGLHVMSEVGFSGRPGSARPPRTPTARIGEVAADGRRATSSADDLRGVEDIRALTDTPSASRQAGSMQIGRWGNSLAVRPPRRVVERLCRRASDAHIVVAAEEGDADLRRQ